MAMSGAPVRRKRTSCSVSSGVPRGSFTFGFVIPGLVRTEPSFMRYRRMNETLRQTVLATPIRAGAMSASAFFPASDILAMHVST